MKIEIVIKNVDNDTMVREFIQRKINTALDRLVDRVDRVTVHLEDEGQIFSGFDGLCKIDAFLKPTGHLNVSAHGASAFDSVVQATGKIERAVKHDIDRHRRSSRVRHEKSKRDFIATLAEESASEVKQTTNQSDESME